MCETAAWQAWGGCGCRGRDAAVFVWAGAGVSEAWLKGASGGPRRQQGQTGEGGRGGHSGTGDGFWGREAQEVHALGGSLRWKLK